MPANFLGLRNVGKKSSGGTTAKATLNWQLGIVTADGDAANIPVPGFGNMNGWMFLLDPSSVQSSFTFGDVKSLQAAVQRQVSSAEGDGTHQYFAGRTWIYIVSTAQLFQFSPDPPIVVAAAGSQYGVTSKTLIAPCDAIQPGIIKVFIEVDELDGAPVVPGDMAETNIALTLFNYEVPPVSV